MTIVARPPKTETLSLRLNPKTKFMLEFMARARRQSVTSVVEIAIEGAAQITTLNDSEYPERRSKWSDFWDADDAIRSFVLISNPAWANYEEELLYSFIKDHWPFFYADQTKTQILRQNIQVLWPKMYEYSDEFAKSKSVSYYGAGQQMAADLAFASLTAPAWPPKPPVKAPPQLTRRSFAADLEDDIPF